MKRLTGILLGGLLLLVTVATGAETAPHTTETILTVKGMICSSCSTAVTKALRGIEGVKDVKVDIRHDLVTVTHDGAKVTPPKLAEAVRKTGYRAEVQEPQPAQGPAPRPPTAPPAR